MIWPQSAAALVTLGLGLLGLLRPASAARFASIGPQGKTGLSEVRATYGGLFAALGGWALWTQSGTVFEIVGLAWAGAAAGRLLSVVADRSFAAKNLGRVAFEGGLAALLLAPHWFR